MTTKYRIFINLHGKSNKQQDRKLMDKVLSTDLGEIDGMIVEVDLTHNEYEPVSLFFTRQAFVADNNPFLRELVKNQISFDTLT